MSEDGERMARIETKLETVLENQAESRERAHKQANELMAMRADHSILKAKIDDALDVKADVAAIKKTHEKWAAVAWAAKIAAYIAGGVFTAMLAVGDRIAKLVAFFWGLK